MSKVIIINILDIYKLKESFETNTYFYIFLQWIGFLEQLRYWEKCTRIAQLLMKNLRLLLIALRLKSLNANYVLKGKGYFVNFQKIWIFLITINEQLT